MYTIIDLCLLCLTNNKNLKSISSRDSNGVLIEEKLRFFLFELRNLDPDIIKQICSPCMEKLNHIYNFKQQCLRNIDKLNTYKYTLNTTKQRCTNLQIQIDTNNFIENQVRSENKANSELGRSENFNLDNISVKKEPNVDDTKKDNEELLKENIVVKQEPGYNSDNNKAQEENAVTGIEETKITEDKVIFEFDDVIVKEEPEDIYNETDTWSKLCDLKEELQNETDNDAENQVRSENKANRELVRSENFNLDYISVKKEPYVDDTKKAYVLQGEHGQKPDNEELLKENIVKQEPDHNSYTNKAQEENAVTGIEEANITEDEVKFEFDDVIVKEEPEDLYNETDTWSKLCDLKEELQNETDNDAASSTANDNITKIQRKNKTSKKRNKNRYNCKDCNKSFHWKSKLTVHERIHSNARPFKCLVCNKTFTLNQHLIRHEFAHNKIRPYKCSVCSKAFIQSSNLTTHERIHTGEKPYKCNVCNTAFTQQSSLKTHEVVHNNVQPHKCSICNKAFKQRNSLRRHMGMHKIQSKA